MRRAELDAACVVAAPLLLMLSKDLALSVVANDSDIHESS